MVTTSVWTPYATALLNGVAVAGVEKARVVSSFTDPVSRAYLSVYPAVSWTQGMSLSVAMGGGINNVNRFTGTIFEGDYANSGPSFNLVAYGPLFKAKRYRNNNADGLTITDLCGGPATDQEIARAVLTVAGVPFISGNIGGTGIVRGTLAPAAYTWRYGETALAYLQRLGQASLGYRMIESIGGDVLRVQVYGRPQGTSLYTFTEGVDIWAGARTQRETLNKYTAVSVTGYDYTTGSGAVKFDNPNPIPAGVEPFVFPSDMIERALESDPGAGISAEAVNANVTAEVDHEIIRVSGVSTPRDELFGPGQTHTVNSPLLGLTNQKLWLYGVTCEADSSWFQHTFDYTGGGSSTGGYTGP